MGFSKSFFIWSMQQDKDIKVEEEVYLLDWTTIARALDPIDYFS
jgi:hypothetical protein